MDPGLIKLLEDDEDETALPVSGAAVDAFAAELNRDVIGGSVGAEAAEAGYGPGRVGNGNPQALPQATPIASGAPDKGDKGPSPQGKPVEGNPAVGTQATALQWNQLTLQQQQEMLKRRRQQHQQQQQHRPHGIADGGPAVGANTGALGIEKKPSGMSYGISFSQLMPLLLPHLPQEQGQQLEALFQRFKINEITREDFVRGCRSIAGDNMLVQTIRQMQLKARPAATNQQIHANQMRQQQKTMMQVPVVSQSASEICQQSHQQPQLLQSDQERVKLLSEQDSNPLPAIPLQQAIKTSEALSSDCQERFQPLIRQTQQQLPQVKAEPQTPQSQQSPGPLSLQQQTMQNRQVELPGSSQLQHPGSQILETVKNEVDKQFKQQSGTGLPVATRLPLTAPVVSGSTQQPPPLGQKVSPLQPPGSQSLQSQGSAGAADKPLSKYQRSKLRKEQKRREEEEQLLRTKTIQTMGVTAVGTTQPVQQSQNQSQQIVAVSHQQSFSALKQQAVSTVMSVKQEPAEQQSDSSQKKTPPPSTSYLDLLASQSGPQNPSRPQVSDSPALDRVESLKGNEQEPLLSSPGGYAARMTGSSAVSTPMSCAFSQETTSYAERFLQHSGFPPSQGVQQTPGVLSNRSGPGLSMLNKSNTPIPSGLTPAQVQGQGLVQNSSMSTLPGSLAGKTPVKKPVLGQKKVAETPPLSQPPSKKQKVAGGDADQTIDQLNDVTAVSGVNLREEEEQLLAGPREESRTTEAIRKAVQDEEDRLFLDKAFLRKKLEDVGRAKSFRSVGDDMAKCLSMATEEFMRSMLYNIIKLSKQRCDSEKDRHRFVVTTDVRRDVLLKRKKEKEALEKKQAEENERLRKMTEKKDKGTLADVEKDELRAKAQKAQQEEEDKIRANAANIAARQAIGADDMLSKWTMLAEQGRQKRQGGDAADGPGGAKEQERRTEIGHTGQGVGPGRPQHNGGGPMPVTTTGRPPGPGPGSASARGRPSAQAGRSQRVITMKDVLAAIERDPHFGKSTLLYQLYEMERKPSSDVADRTVTKR